MQRITDYGIGPKKYVPNPLRSTPSLVNAETKLRNLLFRSSDAIVEMDRHGAIVNWSVGAEHLFLYSQAEALSQSLPDLVLSLDSARRLREQIETLVSVPGAERGREILNAQARRKDGTWMPVELKASVLRPESGDARLLVFFRGLKEAQLSFSAAA